MPDLIINDDNYLQHITPRDGRTTGLLPRRSVYGSLEFAPPVGADEPVIRMEEWPDRIADIARTKSSLKDIWEESGIGVLNQANLPYCHAYSAVLANMIQRAAQGLPYVELSPSSVGAPITNYRAQGAAIEDDLRQMVRVGVATTAFVKSRTTSRSDFKPGWEQDAAKYKVLEWSDVPSRNLLIHGTKLLSRQVCCVGLNYWGHAVTDLVLRDLDTKRRATDPERYGVEFLNSWDATWGNKGFGVRAGSKKYADQCYVPRQIIPG